jgi:hypothetical protein
MTVKIIAQDFPIVRNRRNSRLVNIVCSVLLAGAVAALIFSWFDQMHSDVADLSLILGMSAFYLKLGAMFGWGRSRPDLRKLHTRK